MLRAKSYLSDTLVAGNSYTAVAEGYALWGNKPWPIAMRALEGPPCASWGRVPKISTLPSVPVSAAAVMVA